MRLHVASVPLRRRHLLELQQSQHHQEAILKGTDSGSWRGAGAASADSQRHSEMGQDNQGWLCIGAAATGPVTGGTGNRKFLFKCSKNLREDPRLPRFS